MLKREMGIGNADLGRQMTRGAMSYRSAESTESWEKETEGKATKSRGRPTFGGEGGDRKGHR